MAQQFKNPNEQANSLSLNFPTKPVSKEMLDNEVKSMFRNRKEGLEYINSNYPKGHKDRENALKRLDSVYPREIKGSSSEYTNRINKQYEDLIPFLKEKGYDIDAFNEDTVETHIRNLFDKWHEDEKQKWGGRGPLQESNAYWDSNYKPIFDALMVALDKYYNDDWRKRVPMGYVDD